MSSRTALDESLRRLKPEKHHRALVLRSRAQVLFLENSRPPFPKLLLDTTVYIDALQGRLSESTQVVLRASRVFHSTVTEAEMSAIAGWLNPYHESAARAVDQVAESIDQRPAHCVLNPDREIWREAGILAGLLARLQGYGRNEHRKALNDALIFLTAAKHGCVVLTRNLSDFDLLMQLDPSGSALFYDRR